MTKPSVSNRQRATRRSLIDLLPSITDRDRHLLDLLDQLDVLTTAQVTAILFGSPTTAAHRLLALYRRGLLDRFRRHQPTGRQPWHWILGPLGARLTALAADRTPPTPSTLAARRDRLAASPRLHHLLGVNQFYTDLAAHTRAHPTSRLDRCGPNDMPPTPSATASAPTPTVCGPPAPPPSGSSPNTTPAPNPSTA